MKCQRIGCNEEAKYLLEMTTKTYRPRPLEIRKLRELRVGIYLCEMHYLSCFPDGRVRKQEILKDAVPAPEVTETGRSPSMPPEEEEIMDLLNRHGNKLTCSECGRALTEIEPGKGRHKEKVIAELRLDPGESHYPYEPDVPASVYFVCAECVRNGK